MRKPRVSKRAGRRRLAGVPERNDVARTSIKQIPALFKKINWQAGTRNADVGGGAFDLATDFLAEQGVKNYVYDPFSRPDTYHAVGQVLLNAPADTGTLANVLNVIEAPENRLDALSDLAHFVKPGGRVYISVYKAPKRGRTSSGTWQEGRAVGTYLAEVRQVFPDAKVVAGDIWATVPRRGLSGSDYVPRWNGVAHESAADGETRLRLEIKSQISRLDPENYPALATRLVDLDGYRQVEEAVIALCLRNLISPGAALALLETEWQQ